MDDLLALVRQIVPYHMGHNAETDAVDLLLEVPGGEAFASRNVGCCRRIQSFAGIGAETGLSAVVRVKDTVRATHFTVYGPDVSDPGLITWMLSVVTH